MPNNVLVKARIEKTRLNVYFYFYIFTLSLAPVDPRVFVTCNFLCNMVHTGTRALANGVSWETTAETVGHENQNKKVVQ